MGIHHAGLGKDGMALFICVYLRESVAQFLWLRLAALGKMRANHLDDVPPFQYLFPQCNMRRREFVTLIGVAATLPFAARAQDAGRTYRLGSLHINLRNSPHHVALFDELRRLGFVDGQNLVVDTQGYGLRVEQLAEHASELVKARVDVIICGGTAAIRAAQQATKTIPILATTNG